MVALFAAFCTPCKRFHLLGAAMDFPTAVKVCFSKYANFQGRSCRSEFWFFYLFNFIVCVAIMVLSVLLGGVIGGVIYPGGGAALAGIGFLAGLGGAYILLSGIYSLAVLLPNLAVSVRRLHDMGNSGLWLLLFIVLFLVPFVNLIAAVCFIVWLAQPGMSGENRFGPDPKSA